MSLANYTSGPVGGGMSDASPRQPLERSAPGRVTGKLKAALDAMIWDGLPRKEAAAKAGISEHGLYKALRKPPVKAHYLAELEVLRTSERARNIHTLAEVRDQRSNQMARVQAVKALEQISDDPTAAAARHAAPGLTLVIVNAAPVTPHQPVIEANPLITQRGVQDDVQDSDG